MIAAASITRPSLRALVQIADCRLPIDGIGPKAALVALARLFDDRTGQSKGSNITIGALMGCSADTAKRHLATLCALRVGGQALVSCLSRIGRTNVYIIHADVLAGLDDCKPPRPPVDNLADTPRNFESDPLQNSGTPPAKWGDTPPESAPRTVKGTVLPTGEGTEARAGQALDHVTFPPFPFFEDLKTELPRTAVDEVLTHIADKRAEQLPIGGSDIRRLIEAADASGEVPLAVAADAVRGCLAAVEAPAAAATPALAVAQALPPEAAVAIAPELLAAVNAQRVRNGKAAFKRAELQDLHREATLAGMAPQAAAEWILERPGRNFFRADFYRPGQAASSAQAAPAGPVELTAAGRAAQALRARYESGAGATPPAATPAVVCPVAAASATPAAPTARPPALRTVVRRDAAPVSIGAVTGTGWAQRAVARFVAAEPVNHATITSAAVALGLSLADLKAQRAAALAPVAA